MGSEPSQIMRDIVSFRAPQLRGRAGKEPLIRAEKETA